MPQRPRPRCSHTNCTRKATHDGLCDQHQRTPWQHTSAHNRLLEPNQWARTRKQILNRDHHTCVRCGQPARTVDHITPVACGGALYDPANLQSLCDACNNDKNSEDRRNYQNYKKK